MKLYYSNYDADRIILSSINISLINSINYTNLKPAMDFLKVKFYTKIALASKLLPLLWVVGIASRATQTSE